MKRRNLGIKSRVRKYLNIEHLEKRQLLAADCIPCPEEMTLSVLKSEVIPERTQQVLTEAWESPGQDGAFGWSLNDMREQNHASEWSSNEILEEVGEVSQDANVVTTRNFTTTFDAGSTRASARDLGTVSSQKSLKGSLSYFDRLDVFRFEVSADSNVSLAIGNLWGNADLILANADGSGIATSRNAGTAAESIQTELKAGVYYVAAQARSFWGTNYQLQVSANPISPPADTESGNQESGEGEVGSVGGNVQALPNVPYFGTQRDWNLNSVNAPEAWAAGYTGQGVTVAVVDTGVDLDHPDLASNLFVNPGEIPGNGIDDDQNGYVDDVNGYDFAYGDADADDVNGHGTHVAGTIAALNNGTGATGVAHNAKILPVKVLRDNGSGSNFSVAAGIRYAADLGADVINLSLGGGFSQAVHAAINYANSLGSIVIAAAGNENAGQPSFPARLGSVLNNVVSVGAHNSSDRIAGFSNDVGSSNAVQIDAPGVSVYSTYAGGRFGSLSGTSMASPHVAGVAALALSANPDLTPAELRELLVEGVARQATGSDAIGIVNAATTVAYAAAGFTGSTTASNRGNISQFGANSNTTQAISLGGAPVLATETKTASIEEDDVLTRLTELFDQGSDAEPSWPGPTFDARYELLASLVDRALDVDDLDDSEMESQVARDHLLQHSLVSWL